MELYELSLAVRELWEMYEFGEIDLDTYKDTIESLGTEKVIEEHIKMIRNTEANISKIKEEIDKLKQKADSEECKADFAKKLVIDFLNTLNQKKLEAGLFKVTKCTSKSVDVTDISLIPEQYLAPQPPKVNKKSLLADLKSGKEIKGAKIKESAYIKIL